MIDKVKSFLYGSLIAIIVFLGVLVSYFKKKAENGAEELRNTNNTLHNEKVINEQIKYRKKVVEDLHNLSDDELRARLRKPKQSD